MITQLCGESPFSALLSAPQSEAALIQEVLHDLNIDRILFERLETVRDGTIGQFGRGPVKSLLKNGLIDEDLKLTLYGASILRAATNLIRVKLSVGKLIYMPSKSKARAMRA